MAEQEITKCLKCKKKYKTNEDNFDLYFGYKAHDVPFKTCIKCRGKNKPKIKCPRCQSDILPEEEREYWLTRLNSGRGTEVTPGRFHLVLKDNDITERDEKQLALFTKRFQSVLAEFFGQDRPYYLTELQLLDSKTGSQNQFYHLDNTSSGVTVLVV